VRFRSGDDSAGGRAVNDRRLGEWKSSCGSIPTEDHQRSRCPWSCANSSGALVSVHVVLRIAHGPRTAYLHLPLHRRASWARADSGGDQGYSAVRV